MCAGWCLFSQKKGIEAEFNSLQSRDRNSDLWIIALYRHHLICNILNVNRRHFALKPLSPLGYLYIFNGGIGGLVLYA